jgi:hypothetical protein
VPNDNRTACDPCGIGFETLAHPTDICVPVSNSEAKSSNTTPFPLIEVMLGVVVALVAGFGVFSLVATMRAHHARRMRGRLQPSPHFEGANPAHPELV